MILINVHVKPVLQFGLLVSGSTRGRFLNLTIFHMKKTQIFLGAQFWFFWTLKNWLLVMQFNTIFLRQSLFSVYFLWWSLTLYFFKWSFFCVFCVFCHKQFVIIIKKNVSEHYLAWRKNDSVLLHVFHFGWKLDTLLNFQSDH